MTINSTTIIKYNSGFTQSVGTRKLKDSSKIKASYTTYDKDGYYRADYSEDVIFNSFSQYVEKIDDLKYSCLIKEIRSY